MAGNLPQEHSHSQHKSSPRFPQPERQDVGGNEKKPASRRFIPDIAGVVIVISVVMTAIVLQMRTVHVPVPEDCGRVVDGSPYYFTNVEKGGVTGNLTASWSMECVTERFGEITHIKVGVIMVGTPSSGLQSLKFDTVISFDTAAKAIIRDADNDGRLSTGDSFLVYGMSGPHTWSFRLVWDDDLMQRTDWDTP